MSRQYFLSLPVLLPALTVGMVLAGCGSKTVSTPPAGTTASGNIMNDPQASAVSKAQAAQQNQLAQREQQLMQQTHPVTTPPGRQTQ